MKKFHPCFAMPFLMVGISLGLLLFSGCKSQKNSKANGYGTQEEAVSDPGLHFIKTELYPDGTWKEMSEANRRYSLDHFKLNQSGNPFYLLAIPTMKHCGSGGCRFWVLDARGELISTTSVADFPIGISKNTSNGWYDLLTWSNRKHRVLAWDGNAYTSNASMASGISEEERNALTQHEVLVNPFRDYVAF